MSRERQRAITIWFALTTLASAFLVFQVQPVISKTVLPWFGGSPAVWTTCMLFFQLLLFAGYAYAHLSARLLAPRYQGLLHFTLLAAAVCLLPMTPDAASGPGLAGSPTRALFWILAANVGLPYFLLSATGPLLQHWFSRRLPGHSPYRLYALSNAGSLAALLSYPFLVEPALSTTWQGLVWSMGFCAFAVGCGYLAAGAHFAAPSNNVLPEDPDFAAAPSWRRRVQWLGLPALASVVLLATTNHLCQDIAVIPFLWVAPLSLYLLTFIICFDRESWYSRRLCAALATASAIAVCVMVEKGLHMRLMIEVASYLSFLFWVCMVCHGELVRKKPAPQYLTSFYLMTAAGGAVGGLFVALAAPQLFATHWEMNLGIIASAAVASGAFALDACQSWLGNTWQRKSIAATAAMGIVAYVCLIQLRDETTSDLACLRTFYGVLHVRRDDAETGTEMIHGRTMHGFQFSDTARRKQPTTYYGPRSGVGITLAQMASNDGLKVGAVGLGCGTIAAYARPSDEYRFYEINPAVVQLAQQHFSYLGDCPANIEFILGDARLSLEREPAQDFDVLVLDAFSSDSIPTHLLTHEAFTVYQRHLSKRGVIAVHISNRNLKLDPVVLRLAEAAGLRCVQVLNRDDPSNRVLYSKWMLLTANEDFLAKPAVAGVARHPLRSASDFPLWTDRYNNLFQILTIF